MDANQTMKAYIPASDILEDGEVATWWLGFTETGCRWFRSDVRRINEAAIMLHSHTAELAANALHLGAGYNAETQRIYAAEITI